MRTKPTVVSRPNHPKHPNHLNQAYQSQTNQTKRANPYVGPRAFALGEQLYGREREARRLVNLLIAERIVLLYSPSGAGKTSLIQSTLIPELQDEGFTTLPTIRVNVTEHRITTTQQLSIEAPFNRYLLSVLLSLEEYVPPQEQYSLPQLAAMSLSDYLSTLPTRIAVPTTDDDDMFDTVHHQWVLIFDQFEEILTLNPTDTHTREVFFQQVGEALHNHYYWALFAIREDYMPALDPYVRSIPTRLNISFRLDLLGVDAACQAIREPANAAGVLISDDAINRLVDDLRLVQVQHSDGTTHMEPGPYIEPVQLQVVCYRLWKTLAPNTTHIEVTDIDTLGNVDNALADYYTDQLTMIEATTGVRQRRIREWIGTYLISEQGIRTQVVQGSDEVNVLGMATIQQLIDAHLMRAEKRRGMTWFELAHDRLVQPVRSNNTTWLQHNLSTLQKQATVWNSQNRPSSLLFIDAMLIEAQEWAQFHPDELTDVEKEFLASCYEAQARIIRERRKNNIIRVLAIISTIATVLALFLFFVQVNETERARDAQATAESAKRQAITSEALMQTEKARSEGLEKQLLDSQQTAVVQSQQRSDAEKVLLAAKQNAMAVEATMTTFAEMPLLDQNTSFIATQIANEVLLSSYQATATQVQQEVQQLEQTEHALWAHYEGLVIQRQTELATVTPLQPEEDVSGELSIPYPYPQPGKIFLPRLAPPTPIINKTVTALVQREATVTHRETRVAATATYVATVVTTPPVSSTVSTHTKPTPVMASPTPPRKPTPVLPSPAPQPSTTLP